MDVNDLATMFIGTDPKQHCAILDRSGKPVFTGRIESILYRSEPILKKLGESQVASLCISDAVDEEDGVEVGTLVVVIT